jgi:hypothetical protein
MKINTIFRTISVIEYEYFSTFPFEIIHFTKVNIDPNIPDGEDKVNNDIINPTIITITPPNMLNTFFIFQPL